MSGGLSATFEFLARTENEAAVEVLMAALDYPNAIVRHAALRALLRRYTPRGHREVFRRLTAMDAAALAIVEEQAERLSSAVADALKQPDSQQCAAACHAIVSLRLYRLLPTLVSVLVAGPSPHQPLLAETALKLTEQFYAELSGTAEQSSLKQQDTLRERMTASLEDAARKFARHGQPAVVEAFLLIARLGNATLRQMLQRPDEPAYATMVDILSKSPRGGIIRLLLGFLDDPQMPGVVVQVFGSRSDPKFLEHFLQGVGPRPSKAMAETLSRVKSLAWAEPGHPVFAELSDAAQQGAVAVLLTCSLDRRKVRDVVERLLLEGKPGGRRAAAEAVERFEGPEVSSLVVRALCDEDPLVRAALIVQLRQRAIPHALPLLIRMIDSPHEEVRLALRAAMPEFTLDQFLANFDTMDEQLRPTAACLVRKLDPDIAPKIEAEMAALSPVRRRRAVAAASIMGLAPEVEQSIVRLLADEDHMVRLAAARALADAHSMPVWEALRDALLDRSFVVQEAAEQSLERICRSLGRQGEATDAESAQPPLQEVAP